jgi:hypothetical protein
MRKIVGLADNFPHKLKKTFCSLGLYKKEARL